MLLLNFTRNPGMLDYIDVYIYCPTIFQKTYQNLKRYFAEKENDAEIKYKKEPNRI